MIVGDIKDWERYKSLHPLFEKAFKYLLKNDFSKMEAGKTELDGERMFVIVADSDMKSEKEAKLEVHKRYLDIQMPVSTSESFGWSALGSVSKPSGDFDYDNDIRFFDDEASMHFSLNPDEFAIFYPEDAHAPLVGKGEIRKVIVKIEL